MRFLDHLLLQKQHAEEQERHLVTQHILDDASQTIHAVYTSRRRFRNPIDESRARIKSLQRRAASASATGSQLAAVDAYNSSGLMSKPPPSQNSSQTASQYQQQLQQQPDYVTREVTVRHLNDHANVNPTAFKLYRKLRFG